MMYHIVVIIWRFKIEVKILKILRFYLSGNNLVAQNKGAKMFAHQFTQKRIPSYKRSPPSTETRTDQRTVKCGPVV